VPREVTGSLPICDAIADDDAEPSSSRRTRRVGIALACAAGLAALLVASNRLDDDRATVGVAPKLASVASGLAVAPRSIDSETLDAETEPLPATAVMAALAARRIRALDGLLVTFPEIPPMRLASAAKRCRDLVVDGIDGWRLPTMDELTALGGAHFVAADTIWWRTGVKLRQPRVQWTGKSARALGASRTTDARTLCVRG
jgi:hypothetical protein